MGFQFPKVLVELLDIDILSTIAELLKVLMEQVGKLLHSLLFDAGRAARLPRRADGNAVLVLRAASHALVVRHSRPPAAPALGADILLAQRNVLTTALVHLFFFLFSVWCICWMLPATARGRVRSVLSPATARGRAHAFIPAARRLARAARRQPSPAAPRALNFRRAPQTSFQRETGKKKKTQRPLRNTTADSQPAVVLIGARGLAWLLGVALIGGVRLARRWRLVALIGACRR